MELKEKLVTLRKEKGLTQLAVAEKLDVSRQAISRWESGIALPSTDNLKSLSALYGVPVDYLLNNDARREVNQVQTDMNCGEQAIPQKKAAVIIFASLVCVSILIGRYGLFYRTMYQSSVSEIKNSELHEAISTLAHNIELYIDEEKHGDSERSLRFMYNNAEQCKQEIDRLTAFCTFAATEKGNFWLKKKWEYHDKVSEESIPALVKTSDNLSQGFRILQGFLSQSMDNDIYIKNDAQLKDDLSMAVEQLNVLSSVLEQHNFVEMESDTDLIACYLCFLDEIQIIALDMFSELRS